jgi:hypothetical protein
MRIVRFMRPDEMGRNCEFYRLIALDGKQIDIRKEQVFDRVKCEAADNKVSESRFLGQIVKGHLDCTVLSLANMDHSDNIGILSKSILPYELNRDQLFKLANAHNHWHVRTIDDIDRDDCLVINGGAVELCRNAYCRNARLDRLIGIPHLLMSKWCTRSDDFIDDEKKFVLTCDQYGAWQVVRQAIINSKTMTSSLDLIFASSLPGLFKSKDLTPEIMRNNGNRAVLWDDPSGYACNEAISIIQMLLQMATGYIFILDDTFSRSKLNSPSFMMAIRCTGARLIDDIPATDLEVAQCE